MEQCNSSAQCKSFWYDESSDGRRWNLDENDENNLFKAFYVGNNIFILLISEFVGVYDFADNVICLKIKFL